jgi:ATP-binding cassette subfamily B protein
VTQASLRNAVGLVPQEPVLFHRSIAENIAYGRPEASHDEIVEAARLAHVDEFVQGLPKGYETLVGERGVKLSGGERQRVAIARALVGNPALLLVDDIEHCLAAPSVQALQRLLSAHPGTLVYSTHDPALAALADEVWSLDETSAHDGSPCTPLQLVTRAAP